MKMPRVTNRPVANIFVEPDGGSEVVSQVIYGATVEVLEETSEWLGIRTADRYEGWASRSNFLPFRHGGTGRLVRVAQLFANVYGEPNIKKGPPLLLLPWEARLELEEDPERRAAEADWLAVRLLDGRNAYVLAGDVDANSAILSLDQMLTLATRFLGITYTWGGTSSFGFDCSGFVQMLFRQCGLSLPRDAQTQAAWAGFTAVRRDELQAGDVLFFGEGPDHVTHVGLCVSSTRFIHDTTQGRPGVQISLLAEAPWHDRLVLQQRAQQRPQP